MMTKYKILDQKLPSCFNWSKQVFWWMKSRKRMFTNQKEKKSLSTQ